MNALTNVPMNSSTDSPLTSSSESPPNSPRMCPRCAYDTIVAVATSPVPGVWDVLRCDRCLYMWRTTEPARRTRREAYPVEFRMTRADLDNAPEVPVIPPLEAR